MGLIFRSDAGAGIDDGEDHHAGGDASANRDLFFVIGRHIVQRLAGILDQIEQQAANAIRIELRGGVAGAQLGAQFEWHPVLLLGNHLAEPFVEPD